MNYLAHFHLAIDIQLSAGSGPDSDDGLVLGALLGDFVKGPLRGDYPASWETGIRLHRRIDALTDRHPHSQELLAQLPAQYRRYGGIMLDVCFDHCLSRNWHSFHQQELDEFTQGIYQQLEIRHQQLPPAARRQAQRLQQYDVLAAMQDWRTVENMLARIGQRLRRDNPLHQCAPVLAEQLEQIEATFLQLYPELLEQLRDEFAPR